MNKPILNKTLYIATSVKTTKFSLSEFCEGNWYYQLHTQINIQNMILAHVQ